MLLDFIIGLLFISVFKFSTGYDNYKGFKFLEVEISEERVKKLLKNIEEHVGFMPDFLGENWRKQQAHYFVDHEESIKLGKEFSKNNVTHKFRDLDQSAFKVRRRRNLNGPITINDVNNRYLSYDEQIRFITSLTTQYPNLIRLQNLGNSYEGRSILAARIGEESANKPILWIDAGIHAREWIAYSVALYAINQLVTNSTYRPLLNQVQFVIVANVNPDGYEFSRTSRRMWRKTRSHFATKESSCAGADGNRNYPFDWAGEGVSRFPCSEIYCGTRSSSEPEVAALTSAIQREVSRIHGYVSLHSYGQEILYPWGNRVKTYPPDVEDLKRVGSLMADSIRKIRGNEYKVVNSGDGLYPASGASDDWAKSIGIKYSFTIELSPMDDLTGFALPENKIANVNVEAFEALLTLARQIVSEKGASSGSFRFLKKLRAFTRSRGDGRGR